MGKISLYFTILYTYIFIYIYMKYKRLNSWRDINSTARLKVFMWGNISQTELVPLGANDDVIYPLWNNKQHYI